SFILMKPLIVLLAICTLGYVADHWQELTQRHGAVATPGAHGLIVYGTKTCPVCVRLETELDKQGIPYQKRDLSNEADVRELTDKLMRVGRMGGRIGIPVAEVDGVLMEGASLAQITKRMK